MEIIFFDNNEIEDKINMNYGGMVRRYYSQLALRRAGYKLNYINTFEDLIKFSKNVFMKKSTLWFHYPTRRSISIIAIFVSLLTQKKLILTIHDFPIEQQKAVDGKKYTLIEKYSIRLIEAAILSCSSHIIIAAPGILNYFKPLKNQLVIVMPPGVSSDELSFQGFKELKKTRKIAVYFGSMKRGKAIPNIINIFSKLKEWELNLFGPLEGEQVVKSDNVKHFGQMDQERLKKNLEIADVILIPYPVNTYLNICMPMKLGSALSCCKPIITTRLQGISEYVSYVGLSENVIYIDEWNENDVSKALKEAEKLSIDKKATLEKMTKMEWETRFSELIEIISNNSKSSNSDNMKWI